MNPRLTRLTLPMMLLALATTAAVAEPEKTENDDADVATEHRKALARSANAAAVAEAVESVLGSTKLDLDIRFQNRITVASTDGS